MRDNDDAPTLDVNAHEKYYSHAETRLSRRHLYADIYIFTYLSCLRMPSGYSMGKMRNDAPRHADVLPHLEAKKR